MSGQQPGTPGPRGIWNPRANNPSSPSPSLFMYRPPSPWTPVAPSPPPIISGPRRPSPAPGQMGSPMSPTPFGSGMSHDLNVGLRGSRGTNSIPHPRPQWPQQILRGPQSNTPLSPTLYQPQPFQSNIHSQQTQSKVCPSPPAYVGANGPRPYRQMQSQQQNSYGPGGVHEQAISSFQLSPTPSPICQTPNSEFMYGNRRTPVYETQQQQQPKYHTQSQQRPYEYVGVPLEPPQPKSYVIYDDEEEQGPSTAEIIANQSQDYIDEKLAEYQMTILQLQGKFYYLFMYFLKLLLGIF